MVDAALLCRVMAGSSYMQMRALPGKLYRVTEYVVFHFVILSFVLSNQCDCGRGCERLRDLIWTANCRL